MNDAKTTLLGAALHYNDDLKREVEDWVRQIVRQELTYIETGPSHFERTHINNFATFRRLVREVMKQDYESLRSHGL